MLRHRHQVHQTPRPGHVGLDDRLVLTGVLMPPSSDTVIIAGSGSAAFRADAPSFVSHTHHQFSVFTVQLDLLDKPWFLKAKNLRVKGPWMYHAPVYTMRGASSNPFNRLHQYRVYQNPAE